MNITNEKCFFFVCSNDGEHNINVIFDLVVPHQYENDKLKELVSTIKSKVKEQNNKYTLVIKVDRPYVE